ncbi:helix-turn-helix domain-containing protein [Aurantimonas sp. VKM B-3413]|uniref:helix-turn-helix domain-containing protein n=1 Tax=Aurantimonas sp. VKM B-3413 TaxID=2779401 RepID=UPI001E32E032|nr:helix-turn-helix transcriptional regulator [Aurantimonas sp. VKM B-3413]MCB8840453.1 helix-turn-helix domain-containing protein [Aurantimonas sp. VKM B-3413]
MMDQPIMRTDDDTMGGRIERMRARFGLSTEALAARIGVDAETMRDWERDRAAPGPERLVALAGAFGVNPAWLMEGLGEPDEEVGLDHAAASLRLEELRRQRAAIDQQIQRLEALLAQTG